MSQANAIQDFTLHFCLPRIDLTLQPSHGQTKIVLQSSQGQTKILDSPMTFSMHFCVPCIELTLQPSQGQTKLLDSPLAFCVILIYFSKIVQQPILLSFWPWLYLFQSTKALHVLHIHFGKHLLQHIDRIVLVKVVAHELGWDVVEGFSLITRFFAHKLGCHIFVKGFSLTKLVSRSNPALAMKRYLAWVVWNLRWSPIPRPMRLMTTLFVSLWADICLTTALVRVIILIDNRVCLINAFLMCWKRLLYW